MSNLSVNDQIVLSKIFNREPDENFEKAVIDSSLPADRFVSEEKVEQYSRLEQECVDLIEKQHLPNKALKILNEIISREPLYASAYSNRAQLLRGVKFDNNMPGDQVMRDLDTALKLAKPDNSDDSVSERCARILRKVYGQLAAEYIAQSKTPANSALEWDLQLKANEMLNEARKYGEDVPKDTTIALNPYAKLCGNMVEIITSSQFGQEQ